MLRLPFRAGVRFALWAVACIGLSAGPLAWRAQGDRYIDLGPSDNLASNGLPPIDQPVVQVALYTEPTSGNPQTVGPTPTFGAPGYNFLLDSGSSTILSAANATDDLNSGHLFHASTATYDEQGVAGTSPTHVSNPYRLDFAGTNGIPISLPSTQILASELDLGDFDGIAGTPVMVGRTSTVDMTTLPTDFAMTVQFSTAPPAGTGHRYDVPVQMVNFPLTGQEHPTDPLPTSAPLAMAPVKLKNGTHTLESHFIIDTGAQISIISTATAAALGIDPNDPNQQVTVLQVGGIGGTVDMPVVNTDSFAIHTREGTDMKWHDLNVGVLDIDPQIAGVLGIDVLSNAWLNAFINGTNGNLSKFHFDFRNVANMTGDLLLDVDPSYDVVAPTDSSARWDFNGSGVYSDATKWNSPVVPNGAGVYLTLGNGVVNAVGNSTITITVDGAYTIGSLAFTNSLGAGYVLAGDGVSGHGLTLDNGGQGALISVAPGVTAAQTIQASLILADNVTIDIAGGSSLVVSGGISETGTSRSITLTGTGALTLGAASSFSGGTTVNSGTLTTTAAGALGSGPLAVNADDRVASVVNLGGNETVGGLSGMVTGSGTARVNIAAGKTLTVNQSADDVFAGNIGLAAGGTLRSGGTLTKTGPSTLEIDGAPTLGNNSNLNVNGGTLRFNVTPDSSGTVATGSGVTATVSNSAVLELAGTVSALSSAGNRAHVINNSSTPAGLLVSGTGQHVGRIDGTGTTQVNAGSDLTADHIVQAVLVIGGTATSHGVARIAASDRSGNPLGEPQAGGLGIAGSLAAAEPFGAAGSSSSDSPPPSAAGFSGDPFPASGTPNSRDGTSPVPEPAALLLALIGLGAVVALRALRAAM